MDARKHDGSERSGCSKRIGGAGIAALLLMIAARASAQPADGGITAGTTKSGADARVERVVGPIIFAVDLDLAERRLHRRVRIRADGMVLIADRYDDPADSGRDVVAATLLALPPAESEALQAELAAARRRGDVAAIVRRLDRLAPPLDGSSLHAMGRRVFADFARH